MRDAEGPKLNGRKAARAAELYVARVVSTKGSDHESMAAFLSDWVRGGEAVPVWVNGELNPDVEALELAVKELMQKLLR